MRSNQPVDGMLLLDKPSGPSSNQALQRVKRAFGARKAGHVGTLDPLATGLLPIVLGEATKFAAFVADAYKVYEATVLLGRRTASGDLAGEIIEQRAVTVSRAAIEDCLGRFRGVIKQIPPMHSALKQHGVRLYEIARRGGVVAREPREVHVKSLTLFDVRADEFDVVVDCSKGTYIRVLAQDIGDALGYGATLKRLRRTRVGQFCIEDAVELDKLEQMQPNDRTRALLPPDAGLKDLALIELAEDQAVRLHHGQAVEIDGPVRDAAAVRLCASNSGRFLGVGEVAAGWLRPRRLVATADRAASADRTNDLRVPGPAR
jgi:tRNA pseudouridine55 synthase